MVCFEFKHPAVPDEFLARWGLNQLPDLHLAHYSKLHFHGLKPVLMVGMLYSLVISCRRDSHVISRIHGILLTVTLDGQMCLFSDDRICLPLRKYVDMVLIGPQGVSYLHHGYEHSLSRDGPSVKLQSCPRCTHCIKAFSLMTHLHCILSTFLSECMIPGRMTWPRLILCRYWVRWRKHESQ